VAWTAQSSIITAELKRYWMKKARWWEGGMTLFMEDAKNMQDRAAETAFEAELEMGGGFASRLIGRKLRCKVIRIAYQDEQRTAPIEIWYDILSDHSFGAKTDYT
jgi:hypothetical protein